MVLLHLLLLSFVSVHVCGVDVEWPGLHAEVPGGVNWNLLALKIAMRYSNLSCIAIFCVLFV